MSNNDFDMGFCEYFYYHPCCKCRHRDNCLNSADYIDTSTVVMLKRLKDIIIDGDWDCWEEDK